MIIFLYGPDTYRSRQKLNEIVEHYKKIHKSGLNLKYFDGKIVDFEEFKNEIQSVSMFAEKKLIVLKNGITNKNFQENFLKNFKKFTESKEIILFYEEGEVLENKFVKFLKKYAKYQEFKLLEDQRLKNWVKKEFEKYQAKIEPKALELLITYVGNNLWRMSNEIKKLATYKNSLVRKGHIKVTTVTKLCPLWVGEKDIKLLINPKIEPEIFKTVDAISSRNKKQALELLHKHLEKGDNPLYLLSMINFQFRNLLTIRDLIEKNKSPYTLLKEVKLHPYVIKKSYSQAQRFTLEELKKIYQKIFEVDLAIKTGRIDPETALDLLITEI